MIRAFQNCAGRLQRPTATSGRLSRLHYWRAIPEQSSHRLGISLRTRLSVMGGLPPQPLSAMNFASIVQSRRPTRGCSGSLEMAGTALESSDHPLSYKYGFSKRLRRYWWCKSRRGAVPTYIHTSQLIIKKQCYIFYAMAVSSAL